MYQSKNCTQEEARAVDSRGTGSEMAMQKVQALSSASSTHVSGSAAVPNSIDHTFNQLKTQVEQFIWQTQFFSLDKGSKAPIKAKLQILSKTTALIPGIPKPLKMLLAAITIGVELYVDDRDPSIEYKNQSQVGSAMAKFLNKEKAKQVSEYQRKLKSKDKNEQNEIAEWEKFWERYLFNEDTYIPGIDFTFLDWFGMSLYAFLLPETCLKMSISIPKLSQKKFLGYDAEYSDYLGGYINKINTRRIMTFYNFWLNWDSFFYNTFYPNASPKYLIIHYDYRYREENRSMHIRVTRDSAKNNGFQKYEFGQLTQKGSGGNKVFIFIPYSKSDQKVIDFAGFMADSNTELKSQYLALAFGKYNDRDDAPQPIFVDEFYDVGLFC